MKKENKNHNPSSVPSTADITGNPENCFEMVNKYGTYEIQPTANTENTYPAIAQGLYNPKKSRKSNKTSDC